MRNDYVLTAREKTLLDCAGVLAAMAQELEKEVGMVAEPEPEAGWDGRCRWAYRLGQANGYRYASEAVTETLTEPQHLRPVS